MCYTIVVGSAFEGEQEHYHLMPMEWVHHVQSLIDPESSTAAYPSEYFKNIFEKFFPNKWEEMTFHSEWYMAALIVEYEDTKIFLAKGVPECVRVYITALLYMSKGCVADFNELLKNERANFNEV